MYEKALQKGIQLFYKYCRQSVLTILQKQRVLCHGDSIQRAENSQMSPEQGTIDINTCALTNWSNSAWIFNSDGSMKRPPSSLCSLVCILLNSDRTDLFRDYSRMWCDIIWFCRLVLTFGRSQQPLSSTLNMGVASPSNYMLSNLRRQ